MSLSRSVVHGSMSCALGLEADLRRELLQLTCQPVACAVELIDRDEGLFPEEMSVVRNAAWKRRAEFAAGRSAARRALGQMSVPDQAIPKGNFGEPIWPTGYGGSISHDDPFAAAIVHPIKASTSALSIDLIDTSDLARYWEVSHLVRAAGEPSEITSDPRSAALLFGAKEAAIKLISPRAQCYVGFERLVATRTNRGFKIRCAYTNTCILVRVFESNGIIVSLGVLDCQGSPVG
ncbi:4'-phosphopantetheinyl transferase N-terminal domain-containing protein [Bordetella tumbae]|uniref:hypothetical protein n=1 Tax=Bordetella tumbae TaxID=1649139 RepID=UPI0039EE0199